jgi:hypothetical protein
MFNFTGICSFNSHRKLFQIILTEYIDLQTDHCVLGFLEYYKSIFINLTSCLYNHSFETVYELIINDSVPTTNSV